MMRSFLKVLHIDNHVVVLRFYLHDMYSDPLYLDHYWVGGTYPTVAFTIEAIDNKPVKYADDIPSSELYYKIEEQGQSLYRAFNMLAEQATDFNILFNELVYWKTHL